MTPVVVGAGTVVILTGVTVVRAALVIVFTAVNPFGINFPK
jgi:Flp pilus assembly pilin Flp